MTQIFMPKLTSKVAVQENEGAKSVDFEPNLKLRSNFSS